MEINAHSLQSGIHWLGSLPGHFSLLNLNVLPEATRSQVREGLTEIWAMLADLRVGRLQDFQREAEATRGAPKIDPMDLSTVLLYGRRIFDSDVHPNVLVPLELRPRLLRYLGDGPFKALRWKSSHDPRHNHIHPFSLQTDLAFQFTANSSLAVSRAIVELKKTILDKDLPFVLVRSTAGFKREDHRSWIDFHDGINNMDHQGRRLAIEVLEDDQEWMLGGTYMAFLKIPIDLSAWRVLPRTTQELLVGRDKFWGCPIESASVDGSGNVRPVLAAGCPFTGEFGNSVPSTVVDPGQATNRLVAASHIHRANLLRIDPIQDNDAANRVYRQGFEFFDPVTDGATNIGLNFVGFVRSLRVINDILSSPGWMGDVNFGGPKPFIDGDPPDVQLMSIEYGQYFCAPPDHPPFPGSQLFHD